MPTAPHRRFLPIALLLLAGALPPPTAAQDAAPLLSDVFQDHAVLQRGGPIPVWGGAAPGETVAVALAGARAEARVDAEGRWSAVLPAMEAGGPYTLAVQTSGGAEQAVEDVLVGDVYLCAGQSNMAWPVRRMDDAEAEMAAAADDRLRMLTVGQAASTTERDAFAAPPAWEVASPETVGDWSAVCYTFARALQRHVDVPLGLLHASWGGSDIRAWLGADALERLGGYEADLALLRQHHDDPASAQQAFGAAWEAWWRAQSTRSARSDEAPWRPETGADWPAAPDRLGDWKRWDVPDLQGHHGMVWFRTTVTLTAEQAARDAVLHLGGIDEVDQTWINGHVVGNTFGWGTERTYDVPASSLRAGENVIVVNVLNTWGDGGLVGDPARRALETADGASVPLRGWQYRKAPSDLGTPPRAPWESIAGRTTLHNAMVAPLGGYALRGAVWYQGESNTGEAAAYRGQLEALVAQWRRQFGAADLPVLVVQLANFGAAPTAPAESGWAEVREAQRRAAAADPHAALAVTIDVGDPDDIHPTDKRTVGRRLARAARHVVYGEAVAPTGPVPRRAVRTDGAVVVFFDDVEDGLTVRGAAAPGGFELCGAAPGACRAVEARVDGRRVVLPVEAGAPAARVRYAWADGPVVTLFDAAGLPVGPFEVNVEAE